MNAQLRDKLLAWELFGNFMMVGLLCIWIFLFPVQIVGPFFTFLTAVFVLVIQHIERKWYYEKLVGESQHDISQRK
jgi:Fe2+ transport system protein B